MRNNRVFYVTLAALAVTLGAALLMPAANVTAQSGAAGAPPQTEPTLSDERNTVEIVESRGPSVVAVNVEVMGTRVNPFGDAFRDLPLPRDFLERLPRSPQLRQSSGSGFVISDTELITNYHVVEGALESGSVESRRGAKIRVVFPGSEEEFEARVTGANPDFDLALLTLVDESELPTEAQPLEIADSSSARVGQKVVAIGNPFGLQSSVSQGIISAIGRELPSIGKVQIPMIQTDAAINPGNSGGPLLDSSGRLIGINTMIVPGMSVGGRAGNIGIGFAVPSELLLEALPAMRGGGLVGSYAISLDIENRPRLGVTVIAVTDFPARVREVLNLPDQGMLVAEVQDGSPASEAGVRGSTFEATIEDASYPAGGDVITAVDGSPVRQAADLYNALEGASEGDEVELELWRGGETITVTVELRVLPVPSERE